MTPRVSVILPTYNRPELLYRALLSVQRQTYKGHEVIVVNDAGEGVGHVVEQFPFARYVLRRNNGGLSAARNTGIKHARGHYVTYLDDDDLWMPEHLDTVMEVLETLPHIRAAFTDCYKWYGEQLIASGQNPRTIVWDGAERKVACIICLVHERSVIDEIGGFDEGLREMEDWDFIIRMNRHLTGMFHIDRHTAVYSKRNDPDQLTSNQERMEAAWKVISERHGVTKR